MVTSALDAVVVDIVEVGAATALKLVAQSIALINSAIVVGLVPIYL
ncbi:hypothetical protein GCM10009410_20330 [Shewanella ulleungensis]|jgi:hypothetical protein|uniref:Uncharacterized protein n=1 Tax=Shewanella ulleungensis TaxID=2282699 RepID=A0ABQ2QN49_9GAMM|nr:hypothetical protein GCM10009410_20330 [Shewanella ulleungensis]